MKEEIYTTIDILEKAGACESVLKMLREYFHDNTKVRLSKLMEHPERFDTEPSGYPSWVNIGEFSRNPHMLPEKFKEFSKELNRLFVRWYHHGTANKVIRKELKEMKA